MFRLNQHVAQIITREHGEAVRIDKVVLVSPGETVTWYDVNDPSNTGDISRPPTMRLANNPERLYDRLTGREIGGHDTFVTTRVVEIEL